MTDQQQAQRGTQRFSVSAMRPKLMLEVAAEMVGRNDWPQRNARIVLRDQGGEHDGAFTLVGSQHPTLIADVVRGDVQVAMLNPSAPITSQLLENPTSAG